MKAMDEDPMKFFYVLHDDLSLKSVQIPTRPVWRIRVGTDESLSVAIDTFITDNATCPDNDPDKPIWYVEYRLSIADAARRLELAGKSRAHVFVRPLREKEHDDVVFEDLAAEEENFEHMPTALEDFLPRCCKPNSPIFQTAVRLNRAGSVKEEVKQIASEAVADADKISEKGWQL